MMEDKQWRNDEIIICIITFITDIMFVYARTT